MSESKTQCADCGAMILQRTADRHDGRCVPCFWKAAAIPPQGFQLPTDIAERLVALNEDPTSFRKMAWRHGVDFVADFLDKFEDRNALYREWSPQLRAFADKCRKDQPPPAEESLSGHERAKQRIFEEKFNRNRPLSVRNTVAVCCMPLIAIPVAQRLWLRSDGIVLLTPQEESRWEEMYAHPEGAFRWIDRFWWCIADSPEREFSPSESKILPWWDEKDLQEGEVPWLVSVGRSFGPLAGAGHVELWSWNGRQTKFIKNVGDWIT